MTTDAIQTYAAQTQAAQSAGTTKKKQANDLGITDFLTLMTAQLKNQDPMKPLEGTEFVAQLAQFGTVSGIEKMQTSLGSLTDSMRSSQALNGATLVGHDVLAPASTATIAQGASLQGAIDAPDGVSTANITITDSSGQVVRHLSLPLDSGLNQFSWDGLGDNGAPVAGGTYKIAATGSVGGKSESLDTLLAARVSSVTLDAQGAGLTLNTNALGAIALTDVRRVM